MNDEQLKNNIRQAREGDQDAFTALYQATSQSVYRTIRSMVRDEHLALDIQQNVYVQAFTHLEQLEDETTFLPWLRAIAVNETRRVFRKQTPILFTDLVREDGSDVPEVPDLRPESCPELQAEQKETAELVQEILGSLTDSQRLLVGMYYYEQIPVTRIAEDLGVSPGTVKTQLSRSRKKVETRVKELEEKGIKLYGLSPLPFLLALLKGLRPTKKAGNKVLAGALTESGVTGETVAIHAGRGFFQTLAGRAVIAAAAVTVLGGGIAAYGWYQGYAQQENIGDVRLMESVDYSDDQDTPLDYVFDTDQDYTGEETEAIPVTEEDSPEDLPYDTESPTEPEEDNLPSATSTENHMETDVPAVSSSESAPATVQQETTAPTQPVSQPDEINSSFLDWKWKDYGDTLGAMDWETLLLGGGGSEERTLLVTVVGDDIPEIIIDNSNMVSIYYDGGSYHRNGDEASYGWIIIPKSCGTAHISCRLNGAIIRTLTVTVPEPSDRVLNYSYQDATEQSPALDLPIEDCRTGVHYLFSVEVQGNAVPSLHTDNSAVVEIAYVDDDSYPGVWKPRITYKYDLCIIGAGDAKVYLSLGEKIVNVWDVHASSD